MVVVSNIIYLLFFVSFMRSVDSTKLNHKKYLIISIIIMAIQIIMDHFADIIPADFILDHMNIIQYLILLGVIVSDLLFCVCFLFLFPNDLNKLGDAHIKKRSLYIRTAAILIFLNTILIIFCQIIYVLPQTETTNNIYLACIGIGQMTTMLASFFGLFIWVSLERINSYIKKKEKEVAGYKAPDINFQDKDFIKSLNDKSDKNKI